MSPIGSVAGQNVGASPAPPPSGGVAPNVYVAGFTRYVPVPGFVRLDIEISGADAYVQITEFAEVGHWDDPSGSEFLVRAGFNSIPLVRPAYGWRVRSASSVVGATINARTIG